MRLWRAVKPFIDPVTAAKVRFVYRADAAAAFGELFDASVLPAFLGGALERPAPVRLPAQPAMLAPCPGHRRHHWPLQPPRAAVR